MKQEVAPWFSVIRRFKEWVKIIFLNVTSLRFIAQFLLWRQCSGPKTENRLKCKTCTVSCQILTMYRINMQLLPCRIIRTQLPEANVDVNVDLWTICGLIHYTVSVLSSHSGIRFILASLALKQAGDVLLIFDWLQRKEPYSNQAERRQEHE